MKINTVFLPKGFTLKKCGIHQIPLSLVDPTPVLLREIDGATVNDLRLSIQRYGVLQPILVRPKAGRYEIISGNHRFYAAKGAGLKTILSIVKDVSDQEAVLLALTENIQRLDLDPVKEGESFVRTGLTEKELSERLGKSIFYISNRIRLYKQLHEDLKEEIGKTLTLTNAVHLCKLPPKRQLDFFKEIKDNKEKLRRSLKPSHPFSGMWQHSSNESSYCTCPKCGARHLRGVSIGSTE